jgi:hypothetical protein
MVEALLLLLALPPIYDDSSQACMLAAVHKPSLPVDDVQGFHHMQHSAGFCPATSYGGVGMFAAAAAVAAAAAAAAVPADFAAAEWLLLLLL